MTTPLDSLRLHGCVIFYKTFRVAHREMMRGPDFGIFIKKAAEAELIRDVSEFLIQNPGVATWDGSFSRTSQLRDNNYVEFRYSSTLHSTSPWDMTPAD